MKPGGSADNEEHHGKTHYFDEVGDYEDPDGTRWIVPPDKMANQEADSEEGHHQESAESAGQHSPGAVEHGGRYSGEHKAGKRRACAQLQKSQPQ
jgi:hypothetical protein